MRVVVLTDDHPPRVGGVSVFTARVCRELADRGHDVQVFARSRPGLEPIAGTTLTPVWSPRFSRFGGRALAWRARDALRRADLVLATTWPVASGLGVATRAAVVAHGSDLTRPPRDPAAFARVWEHAGARFALSAFLARRVEAQVLPAPVPLPDGGVVRGDRWAYVARATALKGGDRFVRWIAGAGVEGDLVGDGPELPSWRALAERLRAPVKFHGALSPDDTFRLLGRARVAVLLSRADADGSGAEGFGMCLVEAAAQGVPAIGARVGGVPEAVGPGLVVDDPDCDEAIAQARAFAEEDHGVAVRAWARAHHGTAKTVDALLAATR